MKPIKVIQKLNEGVSWDYYDSPKFTEPDKKYLPSSGEGDTLATQAVTAVTKLVYKWYNDGDVYDNTSPAGLTGWANDLSSYANWLAKHIDGAKDILDRIFDIRYGDNQEYEYLLKDLADLIYDDSNYLDTLNTKPAEGSIYDCSGPYSWSELNNYDDEEEAYW